MPNTSIEARRAYHRAYNKKYREEHKEYEKRRHSEYWIKRFKKPFVIKLHPDTEKVLQSIPHPFGSFERAEYVTYRAGTQSIVLYSFITSCRNTEDCIEIMKNKFNELNGYKNVRGRWCSIYKIQNGIKKLIFREMI